MCWQHCMWRSVLSPSPSTSSWGSHLSEINWGMTENCIFSVLLYLCTFLGLWTWSLTCWSYTLYVCKATCGSKRWSEHVISTSLCLLQRFGFIPCCVFWVSWSRLLLWKYLCQKQGHTININIFISMVITLTVESVFFWCSTNHRMQCCLVFWFYKVLISHPN